MFPSDKLSINVPELSDAQYYELDVGAASPCVVVGGGQRQLLPHRRWTTLGGVGGLLLLHL